MRHIKIVLITMTLLISFQTWAEAEVCTAPNSLSESQSKTDSLFLDLGVFGVYKLDEAEIKQLSDQNIKSLYETYVRRFYAVYMYLVKNIVSIEVHEGYSPRLVDPIIAQFSQLSAEQRRDRFKKLFITPQGVIEENKNLFLEIHALVTAFDRQKGFPVIEITQPDYSPEKIREIYFKKIGIKPSSKSKSNAQTQQQIESVDQLEAGKDKAQKSSAANSNLKWIGFALAGLILGFFIGRLSRS